MLSCWTPSTHASTGCPLFRVKCNAPSPTSKMTTLFAATRLCDKVTLYGNYAMVRCCVALQRRGKIMRHLHLFPCTCCPVTCPLIFFIETYRLKHMRSTHRLPPSQDGHAQTSRRRSFAQWLPARLSLYAESLGAAIPAVED